MYFRLNDEIKVVAEAQIVGEKDGGSFRIHVKCPFCSGTFYKWSEKHRTTICYDCDAILVGYMGPYGGDKFYIDKSNGL